MSVQNSQTSVFDWGGWKNKCLIQPNGKKLRSENDQECLKELYEGLGQHSEKYETRSYRKDNYLTRSIRENCVAKDVYDAWVQDKSDKYLEWENMESCVRKLDKDFGQESPAASNSVSNVAAIAGGVGGGLASVPLLFRAYKKFF